MEDALGVNGASEGIRIMAAILPIFLLCCDLGICKNVFDQLFRVTGQKSSSLLLPPVASDPSEATSFLRASNGHQQFQRTVDSIACLPANAILTNAVFRDHTDR